MFDFAFTQNNNPASEYQTWKTHPPLDNPSPDKSITEDNKLNLIAFYLPQFHPFPENDRWWGKGFTEWTNVSKALPQFHGHYQPRLPGELGFYDLRLPEVLKRQVELAKNYGLYGFCFHLYWFNGVKVLDLPLKRYLEDKSLDFPFCVNWANENWTKTWDGKDQDVLLEQKYSHDDDLAFIKHVSHLFEDSRYIRVNGKPLLMIYRVALFPSIKKSAKIWRNYCKEAGIGDIYLVLTHSFEHIDPRKVGFDAAVEFTPNTYPVNDISQQQNFYNKNYSGMVFDYHEAVQISRQAAIAPYKKFRVICPSWDNEARRPGRGISFINSTPHVYKQWLSHLCDYTYKQFEASERLIFINAWNEWAEGAYLEPDRKFGYGYLESTYQAQNEFYRKLDYFDNNRLSYKKLAKKNTIAVICHLYFFSLWPEIKASLQNIPQEFDLFINVQFDLDFDSIQEIEKSFPNVYISAYENRGRDILPFIKVLERIKTQDYHYICKIHTKKSPHRVDGDRWRNHLILSLIGSQERINHIFQCFENDKQLGLVVARDNLYSYKEWTGSNDQQLRAFAQKMSLPMPKDFIFPAGSMFWFRPQSLLPLLDYIDMDSFEKEAAQIDGTMAHAVERLFGLSVLSQKMTLSEV